MSSGLGFNPSNDGKLVRIPIPRLTEERRKEMVKLVKKMCEDTKIAIRNERRDANEKIKKLEKDKALSEDDAKRATDDIQKLTDTQIKALDEIAAAKEKELMEI
jgi:ribosome recycling factor